MDKIYIVQSFFENYDSTYWYIIGIFTDNKLANEIAKKWEDFYEDKKNIFNEPKDWKPSENDFKDDEWRESEEYEHRVIKYQEIMDFKEIVIDEFDMNRDRTLISYKNRNEHLLSLMTQWDRNHKLEKIIK